MKKEERKNRVIARGEQSNHSHVITGECEVVRNEASVIVKAGKNCAIKHLLEREYVEEGVEVWTKEHVDIPLTEGESYEYVQQQEYNPYEKAIERVKD